MIDPEERAFEAIRRGVQGQADRVAALEAALRYISRQKLTEELDYDEREAADFVSGFEDCVKTARAALAPAPAPAVANPVAWHIERDTERENLLTDHQEVAAIYEMDGYKVTPLYALAPAPAPEGE